MCEWAAAPSPDVIERLTRYDWDKLASLRMPIVDLRTQRKPRRSSATHALYNDRLQLSRRSELKYPRLSEVQIRHVFGAPGWARN